jgi:hypothetical protein
VYRRQTIYRYLNLLALPSVTWDFSYFKWRQKSTFVGDLSEIAGKKNVRESFMMDR